MSSSKLKKKKNLEAYIDSLHDSLEVVAHNSAETSLVCDRILEAQESYKRANGDYYTPSHKYLNSK